MRELNYVEGQNLIVRLAFAVGRPECLPSLIAELMEAKVDVIVTTSTQETMAAKRATSTIPIVMTINLKRAVLGSVRDRVIRHAPRPIVTVPESS